MPATYKGYGLSLQGLVDDNPQRTIQAIYNPHHASPRGDLFLTKGRSTNNFLTTRERTRQRHLQDYVHATTTTTRTTLDCIVPNVRSDTADAYSPGRNHFLFPSREETNARHYLAYSSISAISDHSAVIA